MPSARNASVEDRGHAVCALAERIVRGQVEELSEGDRQFMEDATHMLTADLRVIREQAMALWSPAFRAMMATAHSMRQVVVSPDDKERGRGRTGRCDACGRHEECCGFALDVAGNMNLHVKNWNDTQNLSGKWFEFKTAYDGAFEARGDNGLLDDDYGRFYVGRTCLRKAKLAFNATSLLPDTLYNAFASLSPEQRTDARGPELFGVDDEVVDELLNRKERLELCIADERRHDDPDLLLDGAFWETVDDCRNEAPILDVAVRAASTLELFAPSVEPEAEEDERDGEFGVSDEEDGGETDDEVEAISDEDECGGGGPPRANPSGKRRRVLDSDGEDGDKEERPAEDRKALPPKKRTLNAVASRRRSRRVRGLTASEEPEVAAAVAVEDDVEDADDSDEDVRVCDLVQPARAPAPRTTPPSARSHAASLRIPRDGEPGILPSRRAVLLDLIKLQGELVIKNESALSVRVGAAVLTMQELMEISDRARGGSQR